jgi:hypothetical protein
MKTITKINNAFYYACLIICLGLATLFTIQLKYGVIVSPNIEPKTGLFIFAFMAYCFAFIVYGRYKRMKNPKIWDREFGYLHKDYQYFLNELKIK